MANKLEPVSSHPWLVRTIDLSTKSKKAIFEKAYEKKLDAEYVGIEVQNRLSNVEGQIITEIVDRKENEVWETFRHYNASKGGSITDIVNDSFPIPPDLDENEMLWLCSSPTESLQKHRAEKAKELKRIEALKAKNSKPKTR